MTHEERLRLIYRPFPEVRRITGQLGGGTSAMTWAGTIVADTFYGRPDLFLADKDKRQAIRTPVDQYALPRYGWSR